MSDNKKYYYLKLKENFFDSEEMIILQNMPDGYLYSDILMKLYLRSLKSQGKLMFNDYIPYNAEVLAQIVRHQVGTVEKALSIFQKLGLIEILDNGAIYMLDIQNLIGKSSTEADRKRNYRARINAEKQQLLDGGQMSNQMSGQMGDKNPPEIEIDIEKEIEIEKEKGKKKSKRKTFTPPTLKEIEDYIKEKQLNVDANKFFTYFEAGSWVDSKGNKVKNWKQKLITWDNHNYGNNNAKSKNNENKQEEQVNYEHELTYSEKDFTEEQYARLRRGQMPKEELIEILEKKNV